MNDVEDDDAANDEVQGEVQRESPETVQSDGTGWKLPSVRLYYKGT
jgi:hypothetical protein